MKTLRFCHAFYPLFPLGSEPAAVACSLSVLQTEDGRYDLKTPFAWLDAAPDARPEDQLGRGYYATEAECLAYLEAEYPSWRQARPLMAALVEHRRYHGDTVGRGRLCDLLDVSPCGNELYQLARGHKRFTPQQIKRALRDLQAGKETSKP